MGIAIAEIGYEVRWMDDSDAWQSAAILIQRHGIDASVHACLAANAALSGQDHDQKEYWIAVWHAITDTGTVH